MKHKNQVVIVTGGSRDIGKAISMKFAKEGAKVIVNYCNNEKTAEETVAEIQAFGGTAMAIKADMTKQAEVKNLIQ